METPYVTYTRWIWSDLETVEYEAAQSSLLPVAREYATHGWSAFHFGDKALCRINTGHAQIEAAAQDHRLIILGSLMSTEVLPSDVANALSDWGVTLSMTLAQAIDVLSQREPHFLHET